MILLSLLFGAVGLVFGSFGNVLVLRILAGESIGGRSHCPRCKHVLSAIDLVPLLSYLALRGRCRYCRKPVSIQYPIVESLSAALFVLALALHPDNIVIAVLTAFLLAFLLFACTADTLRSELPDVFTIFIAAIAVIVSLVEGSLVSSLLGALIPLLWFGGQWVISRGRYVGSGDIFLATALGFWLGYPGSIILLVGSYIVGAVLILVFMGLGRKIPPHSTIAFGPFLGLAALLTLLGVGDAYLALL